MSKTLRIGYFYPDLLNLYGDNGNVEILAARAKEHGLRVDVFEVKKGTLPADIAAFNPNLVFMGGGPDSAQKEMYKDLKENKTAFLKKYIEEGLVGLYVCGSYQLLGKYYKSADGSILEGLGVFDLYTEHFGKKVPRCIGNTTARLAKEIVSDPVFTLSDGLEDKLVGFENHGGRTFLGKDMHAFARILKGSGNNSQDKTEGVLYKNSIGTYFHGPLLARNPHLADYLIYKALALREDEVARLLRPDDTLIVSAHTASLKLKA